MKRKTILATLFALIATIMCAFAFTACAGASGKKVTPVFSGITLERSSGYSASRYNAARATDDEPQVPEVTEDDNTFDKDITEEVLPDISVETTDAVEYYAEKNTDIFLNIHIYNPSGYAILRFTLNDTVYQTFQFEYGSNSELIILKVNTGADCGVREYTIDSIKYVDDADNLNKDVDMTQANKTVKVGVQYDSAPSVTVGEVTATTEKASLGVTLSDTYSLIAENNANIYLYDGKDILQTTPLVKGNNDIVFNGLTENKTYRYAVIGVYDILDGNGEQKVVFDKGEFKTKAYFNIDNATTTQTGVSFTYSDNAGERDVTFDCFALHDELGKAIRMTDDINVTEFTNLLSDTEYTLALYYSYTDNGKRIQCANKVPVKTVAKTVPTVSVNGLSSTRTELSFDTATTDPDNILNISSVKLYDGDNSVAQKTFDSSMRFDGLDSGKLYRIEIEYAYDLNDGKGAHTQKTTAEYPTLVGSITVDDLVLVNNNVVKSGEELNLRVYFNNSAEIELTAIYINGQKTEVTGGDRVESAIVRFIPNEVGLIDFTVSRVDYVYYGKEINQAVDSDVSVTYPIYGDLDVTFEAVTASPYEYTGGGTYIRFDNAHGYTVYEIGYSQWGYNYIYTADGEKAFIKLSNGAYYVPCHNISTIKYGYDDYGATTQTFEYSAGDGKQLGGYTEISTADEFYAMTSGYYILKNDIDLRKTQTPHQIKLTGILDGKGHTVRGLSNVLYTNNTAYYDLFNGGSIYDTTFTELYVSITHAGERLRISALGNVKLFNCTVKGDILGTANTEYREPNIIDNSVTLKLNITIGSQRNTVNVIAQNTIAKNSSVVFDSGCIYCVCGDGNRALAGYYDNTETSLDLENIFTVNNYAFSYCSALTRVVMPDVVVCYGNDGYNYIGLDNCALEYAQVHVGTKFKTENLKTLILFGKGSIKGSAFRDCTGLTSVTIGNGVTSIEHNAFGGCTGLTSITIPNSVTSIGAGAFYGCSNLTSVTIPDSVTSIGSDAFRECTNIQDIYYTGDVADWCAIDGIDNLMRYGKSSKNLYFNGKLVAGDLVIPDSVTSIGGLAFYGCTGLTSVTIGNGVTSIGGLAFYGCTGLTSVTIGNGVTSIGSDAFRECTNIQDIYYTGDVADWCAIDGIDNLMRYGKSSKNLYFNGKLVAGDLVIPDSVTSIGDSAFSGCAGLTSVTIPNSVTSIGSDAFRDCTSLTSVTIGNSVTSIGDRAFCGCTGLTSVTIGNDVTSIGDRAFYGCSKLKTVYYKGTAEDWVKISIDSGWNDNLTNATRYYYSEVNPYLTNPDDTNKYWHYNGDKIAVWTK